MGLLLGNWPALPPPKPRLSPNVSSPRSQRPTAMLERSLGEVMNARIQGIARVHAHGVWIDRSMSTSVTGAFGRRASQYVTGGPDCAQALLARLPAADVIVDL